MLKKKTFFQIILICFSSLDSSNNSYFLALYIIWCNQPYINYYIKNQKETNQKNLTC